MKILMIMGGFFPGKKYGGPPVSVDNFCTLMGDYECCIVTTNHDLGDTEEYSDVRDGWNERDNCKVLYLKQSDYQKRSFKKILTELRPDFLYLQGLFQSCVLPCLQLAKKLKIKVLLAPRGELCAGAFKKKYKKIPYISFVRMMGLLGKNVLFQSTSDEETEAIKRWLRPSGEEIYQISNVPSIPKKIYPHAAKEAGSANFVFLSRIVSKKNLLVALTAMKTLRGKVNFDIYGPIEDPKYWDECLALIKNMPENIQVNYRGLVEHDRVHEIFSGYDAFVFPTHSENFGHVIAEALAVGTYVIISDQTPFTDASTHDAGKAIPLAQQELFSAAMQEVVDWGDEESVSHRKSAEHYVQEKLDLQHLKEQYQEVFI